MVSVSAGEEKIKQALDLGTVDYIVKSQYRLEAVDYLVKSGYTIEDIVKHVKDIVGILTTV